MMPISPEKITDAKLAIIGLGYVGLPLAVAFARKFPNIVGFDIDKTRISALKSGYDQTGEISFESLSSVGHLRLTADVNNLVDSDIYIVTVPTPIDDCRAPDLSLLKAASATVAGVLSKGNVVIYESTVYPGVTEEVCIPIIEGKSGLKCNIDFFVGYSPERINPGDKVHTVEKIVKLVSGSTQGTTSILEALYSQVVEVGIHSASSIKVAEAAKVIENTQRDLNIALMNELAIIFERLDIDTIEVLEAAGTKWNFLPFRPGLVGGHCIGVDPYYLTHIAERVGYHPQVILAGRRINDSMGHYVVCQVMKLLNHKGKAMKGSRVLILGLTFKENCPDLRNSRVFDIIEELKLYDARTDVYEPVATDVEVAGKSFEVVHFPETGVYDAIICAVAHTKFIEMGMEKIRAFGKPDSVIFDVKSSFAKDMVDGRL